VSGARSGRRGKRHTPVRSERDLVAGHKPDHLVSDRLHRPRSLMTQHQGPTTVAKRTVGQVQVGMTHARRRYTHEHLIAAWGSNSTVSTPTSWPGSRRTTALIARAGQA